MMIRLRFPLLSWSASRPILKAQPGIGHLGSPAVYLIDGK
jgi:hypothetical protein